MGLKGWITQCLRPIEARKQRQKHLGAERSRETQGTSNTLYNHEEAKKCEDLEWSPAARMVLCQALIEASPEPISVYDPFSGKLLLSNEANKALSPGCNNLGMLFALDPKSLEEALVRVQTGLCWRGLIQLPCAPHTLSSNERCQAWASSTTNTNTAAHQVPSAPLPFPTPLPPLSTAAPDTPTPASPIHSTAAQLQQALHQTTHTGPHIITSNTPLCTSTLMGTALPVNTTHVNTARAACDAAAATSGLHSSSANDPVVLLSAKLSKVRARAGASSTHLCSARPSTAADAQMKAARAAAVVVKAAGAVEVVAEGAAVTLTSSSRPRSLVGSGAAATAAAVMAVTSAVKVVEAGQEVQPCIDSSPLSEAVGTGKRHTSSTEQQTGIVRQSADDGLGLMGQGSESGRGGDEAVGALVRPSGSNKDGVKEGHSWSGRSSQAVGGARNELHGDSSAQGTYLVPSSAVEGLPLYTVYTSSYQSGGGGGCIGGGGGEGEGTGNRGAEGEAGTPFVPGRSHGHVVTHGYTRATELYTRDSGGEGGCGIPGEFSSTSNVFPSWYDNILGGAATVYDSTMGDAAVASSVAAAGASAAAGTGIVVPSPPLQYYSSPDRLPPYMCNTKLTLASPPDNVGSTPSAEALHRARALAWSQVPYPGSGAGGFIRARRSVGAPCHEGLGGALTALGGPPAQPPPVRRPVSSLRHSSASQLPVPPTFSPQQQLLDALTTSVWGARISGRHRRPMRRATMSAALDNVDGSTRPVGSFVMAPDGGFGGALCHSPSPRQDGSMSSVNGGGVGGEPSGGSGAAATMVGALMAARSSASYIDARTLTSNGGSLFAGNSSPRFDAGSSPGVHRCMHERLSAMASYGSGSVATPGAAAVVAAAAAALHLTDPSGSITGSAGSGVTSVAGAMWASATSGFYEAMASYASELSTTEVIGSIPEVYRRVHGSTGSGGAAIDGADASASVGVSLRSGSGGCAVADPASLPHATAAIYFASMSHPNPHTLASRGGSGTESEHNRIGFRRIPNANPSSPNTQQHCFSLFRSESGAGSSGITSQGSSRTAQNGVQSMYGGGSPLYDNAMLAPPSYDEASPRAAPGGGRSKSVLVTSAAAAAIAAAAASTGSSPRGNIGVLPRMLDLATKASNRTLRPRASASRLGQGPCTVQSGSVGVGSVGGGSNWACGTAASDVVSGMVAPVSSDMGTGCGGARGGCGAAVNGQTDIAGGGVGRFCSNAAGAVGARPQSFSRFWMRGDTMQSGTLDTIRSSKGSSGEGASGGVGVGGAGEPHSNDDVSTVSDDSDKELHSLLLQSSQTIGLVTGAPAAASGLSSAGRRAPHVAPSPGSYLPASARLMSTVLPGSNPASSSASINLVPVNWPCSRHLPSSMHIDGSGAGSGRPGTEGSIAWPQQHRTSIAASAKRSTASNCGGGNGGEGAGCGDSVRLSHAVGESPQEIRCGAGSVLGLVRGRLRATSPLNQKPPLVVNATGNLPSPGTSGGCGVEGAGSAGSNGVNAAGGAIDMERWHEVVVSGLRHPLSGAQLVMVTQHDVSARVWAEQQLARVMEAEHALLEAIFPAHVIEHIAVTSAAAEGDTGVPPPPRPTLSGLEARAVTQAEVAGLAPSPASPRMHRATEPPALPITGETFLHLATSHTALTILFCDIQGFTSMCNVVKPATVMAFLNDLYTRLDAMLDAFGVYKVETIGDCYVAAGGLMKVDPDTGAVTVRSNDVDPQHAHRTVQFAKALLRAAAAVRLPTTGESVRLRVGIHSGPAMSGVVGTRMPRFCLFGDTINTASRMESTGLPGAIHVSQATRDLLPHEQWEPTGGVEAKGKGLLQTYLLRPPLDPW